MSVVEYLQLQQQQFSEYNEYWSLFEEYYNKKLWHQLTKKIESFVKIKLNEKFDLVAFYHRFISDFESKLNLLSLIEIISFIIKHMKDYQECLTFLNKMKEKVRTNHYATLLCSILISQLKLANRDLDGK
jgi:26S proteasome regulatory complex, subunit RPN9/PSMD13, putative